MASLSELQMRSDGKSGGLSVNVKTQTELAVSPPVISYRLEININSQLVYLWAISLMNKLKAQTAKEPIILMLA